MHGRYEQRKPKKKGGKIALIILAVVAGLLVAAIGVGVWYYSSQLNRINRAEVIEKELSDDEMAAMGLILGEEETTQAPSVPETTETEPTVTETLPMTPEDIINILVVGQASRPGEESRMADSTMLVTINKYTKTVTLNSVQRDAFVKYPQYKTGKEGRCKLTSAYAVAYSKWDLGGAMDVMNLVMEQNFGVNVDHNFEVDFEMFIKCIDAMEGLEMELTEAETNYLNKELGKCGYEPLEPGYNSLDGFGALTFARMRKAEGDSDSDLVRTARQRYLVDRIINKLKWILGQKGVGAIQTLSNAVIPYMTTNMENSEITQLLMDMIPILPELTIEKGTIPVQGTYKGEMLDIYGDGQLHSILRFDAEQNKKLLRPITEGNFS